MSVFAVVREELGRLFRFGIVGVAATAVYWVVTVTLAQGFGIGAVFASLLGVACSASVSYFGHQIYSFRVEPDHDRYVLRFILVNGFTLGLNLLLIWLIVDIIHFAPAIGATAVVIVIPCLNYVLNKYFVFQPAFGCRRA